MSLHWDSNWKRRNYEINCEALRGRTRSGLETTLHITNNIAILYRNSSLEVGRILGYRLHASGIISVTDCSSASICQKSVLEKGRRTENTEI